MAEQNKAVQAGAAICIAKMVESARETPLAAFQKLCPRICKYLANPNFLAKAAVLSVVSSLSQVWKKILVYCALFVMCFVVI